MCKCTKLLKEYVDWCTASSENYAGFTLVTAEITRNQLVSYTTGALLLDGSHQRLTNLDDSGKKFRSIGAYPCDGIQLFSDRMWSIVPAGSSDFSLPKTGPFNPDAPDKLGVQIDVQTGHTTLTLVTWGFGQAAGDLRCANGLMYGFMGSSAVILTLSKQTVPPHQVPR